MRMRGQPCNSHAAIVGAAVHTVINIQASPTAQSRKLSGAGFVVTSVVRVINRSSSRQ